MSWIKQIQVHLFPPVTKDTALEIASQALVQSAASEPLVCHGRKPDNLRIYASLPEPCWYVQVPWDDDKGGLMIRSSRVIVIGRQTGVIHYEGSAGDEG